MCLLFSTILCALHMIHSIITAFLIEPYNPSFGPQGDHPNSALTSPIRGIMTTYGYALPDPQTPERLSVCFSGRSSSAGSAGIPTKPRGAVSVR